MTNLRSSFCRGLLRLGSPTRSESITRGLRTRLVWGGRALAATLGMVASLSTANAAGPLVTITTSHTVITQSCRVRIPHGLVIADPDDTGVIIVGAPGIQIEFEPGSVLRGSAAEAAPDTYHGYGIRLHGQPGVTIRGAHVSGYWCGLWAMGCDGLTLAELDASDNRRARLKSTPVAEDAGDWLYGHNNDDHEWLKNYGAAMYLERCRGVTVRDSRVWHGQNALCLDRVTDARIYDNDFSFNSGWGIALWRCERNLVSRNAFDFCVRGYSHGVYNRGQDSAGIFAFEQNCDNVFCENSVTHGGDGFFGFAGREALGEIGSHPVEWYRRRGNSGNLLIGNDFSYAVAHGIENTFSFGNRYLHNRIVGNAICGVWAGYSRDTLIAGNLFEDNGGMGYGLERGGVNIDHGGDNRVLGNTFRTNKCGVHLWGGANADFDKRPWATANGYASTGSVIAGNQFEGDLLAFQFRGPGSVGIGSNHLAGVGRELLAEPAYAVERDPGLAGAPPLEKAAVVGRTRPFGARASLRGRENIIMTEWGPWDHASPLVRLVRSSGGVAEYEVDQVPRADLRWKATGDNIRSRLVPVAGSRDRTRLVVEAEEPGVHPYRIEVFEKDRPVGEVAGTFVAAVWEAKFFKWPAALDPREHPAEYRRLAAGPSAVPARLDDLTLRYGMRGPSELGISDQVTAAHFGVDHFGMEARTRLPLTKGTWEFTTTSDDGIRVTANGKAVIDNWTWHGPTRDTGKLELAADTVVEIVVEHFQIDGYAVLEFQLARAVGSPEEKGK